MHDFGYCIWLVSSDNKWDFPDKGFRSHITLFKNLSSFDATRLFLSLQNENILVERENKLEETNTSDFYCLQFPVTFSSKNKQEKPPWWPIDAHISIKYNYNNPVNCIQSINNIPMECMFDEIIIMKCHGHYRNWSKIM